MAKKKFTFKKQPKETGLRAVGHPYPCVDIKLDGKVVGTIYAPNWQLKGWRPALMVYIADSENCNWSWWQPKKVFETEQEARDWLNSPDCKPPADLRASPAADE